MRVVCHKLELVPNAVFFWEEEHLEVDKYGNNKPVKRKRFQTLAQGEEFEVSDDAGHVLCSTYKENLRVVRYGDGTEVEAVPAKKAAASPRTMMLKDERDK